MTDKKPEQKQQQGDTASLMAMLLAAFMVGAAVMSLEMLASRYLNPYFGGTIFTWAALISIVLLAMMAGYFFGGYSADRISFPYILEVMIVLAALYMLALPLFVDPLLEWVVSTVDDVKLGALIGAFIITGPPVAFLSTFSPITIRRTLQDLDHTGRISGTVFATNTAGNIVGTLVTSFYLIPLFGTRTLTMWLAALLAVAVLIVLKARGKGWKAWLATVMLTGGLLTGGLVAGQGGGTSPAYAASEQIIESEAGYPEGPVYINGQLYYAEMTRNRVMIVEKAGAKPRPFFYQRGCGPTALAEFGKDKILILCHLGDRLVMTDRNGKVTRTIKRDSTGTPVFHPNDCVKDEKGGIYITAPGHFHMSYQPMGQIFYLNKAGEVKRIKNKLTYPNGIAIYKGELYVSEHLARRVIKFKIKKPGNLGQAKTFTKLPKPTRPKHDRPDIPPNLFGPDGIEISKTGKIHIAYYGNAQILTYETTGNLNSTTKTKARYVTNLALGPDGRVTVTAVKELRTPLQVGVVYEFK